MRKRHVESFSHVPPRSFRIGSRLLLAGRLDRRFLDDRFHRRLNGPSRHIGADMERALRTAALSNTSSAAGQSTEVVELGAANLTETSNLDLVDARRVDQEGALDADAMRGDAANREVFIHAAGTAANNDAFKNLDALAVPFDDLRMHANGVSGAEGRHLRLELLFFDVPNHLSNHAPSSLICFAAGKRTRSGSIPRSALPRLAD